MATLSPMMQHYLQTKQQNPDAILFYRLGDFYEMFFDDAVLVAKELELTLTGKECGLEERAPMAGVPWHASQMYIAKLIQKGYKVAICEQVEDPKTAKGLVKREVVRIVTPGTVVDQNALAEKQNNYLCCVYYRGGKAGVAACDVSTGEFFALMTAGDTALKNALARFDAREVITNDQAAVTRFTEAFVGRVRQDLFSLPKARETLTGHFQVGSLDALGFDRERQSAAIAAGALLGYLFDTQKIALPHINRVQHLAQDDTMPLDAGTRRNMELVQGLKTQNAYGSLLWVLDKTVTAMGARKLRQMVEQPLLDGAGIQGRLSAVADLFDKPILQRELAEGLTKVYDMERLLSRVSYQTLSARDCLSLLRSMQQAPLMQGLIAPLASDGMRDIHQKLAPLLDLQLLLERAIDPEAPLTMQEGGMIRTGFSKELDRLRTAQQEGSQWLTDLELQERDKTGIKNLKIQYNRVFGYYFEVTKSYLSMVPEYFARRQTLANCERFTTEALKELEQTLLTAKDKALQLEMSLFENVRREVKNHLLDLKVMADGFKSLDAYLSLARVAMENGYVRPRINDEGRLMIRAGRHPVVECTLKESTFVPNDAELDNDNRIMVITGPNMAGKSTYMRQTALIILMAHMGSFVPAEEADIPLCDNVFTRIGASDDLAGGQSTFMVEMTELSGILRLATARSFIVLDEIGRGTGTFDGLSIAWATLEHLADPGRLGAKTLFATHYHELSALEGVMPGVKNYSVSVKEMGEDVLFLHRIQQGGGDKSFGVYVAKLAGVPHRVVMRAREIQARLEVSDINQQAVAAGILEKKRRHRQTNLLDVGKTELIEELSNLDVMQLTPMDALNRLFVLREKARKL